MVAEKQGKVVAEKVVRKSFEVTTRNQSYMEMLLAALEELNKLADGAKLEIICDYKWMVSELLAMEERAKRGFCRKDGKKLKNEALWEKIHEALSHYRWWCGYMELADMKEEAWNGAAVKEKGREGGN